MFEKLKKKLSELAKKHQQYIKIDSSQFNDSIADKTDWAPLNSGGANFKTHNLVTSSQGLMQYKLSGGGMAFIGLFAVIGIIIAVVGIFMLISGDLTGIFLILFGLVFTGCSYLMYRFMGKPVIFDARMGCLWKGHKPPKFAGDKNTQDSMIYFSNIHAIQVIRERVRGNKTTYSSYEINLVLKDSSRFNIIDHGDHSQILIDAETISTLIGKPVWDVT